MAFIPGFFIRNATAPFTPPTIQNAYVFSGNAGAVFTLTRLLGGSSTIALISGSNPNLGLAGTVLNAAAGVARGTSQLVLVRESLNGTAVEYPINIINPNPKLGLAVYTGNDTTTIATYENFIGRSANVIVTFFNQTSWSNFDAGINYQTNQFKGRNCVWSVPLSAEYGGLPSVVNGTRDAIFTKCAAAILAAAPANEAILIRTGWEFNLLGQEQRAYDGASPPNATPAVWVAAYRRVIALFRAISDRFRFIWCTNNGDMTADGLTVTDCYPGDDVVDYVATDLYYNSAFSNPNTGALGADTFGYDRDRSAGLNWLVSFGAAHGKPVMIPEYGCNSNIATGWLSAFRAWMVQNNIVLSGAWESNGAIATLTYDGSLPALGVIQKQYDGPPIVTNSNTSDSGQNTNYTVALTTNQDGIYPITWSVVSGGASVSGNILTITGVSASTVPIVVRATNSLGIVGQNFTINHIFKVPYTFQSTEASSYVARMTLAPTESRKQVIDNLFVALKSGATSGSNIYSKLAQFGLLAAHSPQAALLHCKSAASCTAVNGIPFTTDRGFTGRYAAVGSQWYINTNRAVNAGGGYAQNSASMGVWQLLNIASNSAPMGGGPTWINPRNNSNIPTVLVNDYTGLDGPTITDSRGMTAGNRSSSTSKEMYKNGSLIASTTSNSSAGLSGDNILLCTGNAEYPDAHQPAFWFVGASLTAAEHLDLYNAVRTYLVAVGAVA